jgi:hypothetical protein
MSEDENKTRFGARVKNETLEQLEEYQHENGLDNRSAAIEHLVEHRDEIGKAKIWETIQQQTFYAVTFALTLSLISLISFVVAFVQSGYPSPWTVASFAFLVGGILAATGAAAGHELSKRRATLAEVEQ